MTNESPSGIEIYRSHPWNLIKTGFLVLTWIALAFHLEIVAPTMTILAANIGVVYSGMGSALASRSAGYFVANVLGVILQNIVKQHSDALLACAFILPAIVVFTTPFVGSLILLCVLFFIQGFSQGLTDLGGTNLILTMWGVNAAAPLNTAHLGYGIGAVFVNLLVRPFLTKKALSTSVTHDPLGNSSSTSDNVTKANANIFIPYSITAALCVLIAAGHIFFYIQALKTRKDKLEVQQVGYAAVSTNPENESPRVKQEDSSPYSPRTCGRGYFQYGLILSIIFICYIFFIGANDQTFSKFFFAFLESDQFNISTGAASWGIILYWLSYSIGRLIAAIVSIFVPVHICLNVVWLGGLCLAVAWLIFVWVIGLSGTSLFILGAATGLVFAPIFPLSFGFFNQKLNVVPMLIALLLCGSALGALLFQKVAGFVMDNNRNHFPTLLIVCILMSILLYAASNVIAFIHQRNVTKDAQTTSTVATKLSAGVNEEEQEMASYLRAQEDK